MSSSIKDIGIDEFSPTPFTGSAAIESRERSAGDVARAIRRRLPNISAGALGRAVNGSVLISRAHEEDRK